VIDFGPKLVGAIHPAFEVLPTESMNTQLVQSIVNVAPFWHDPAGVPRHALIA
jgi:hypothetical protein